MFAVQCTTYIDIKYHQLEKSNMSIESTSISSIMVKEVKTAKEDQTVKSVAKIMTDNNIGSVVIVKHSDTNYPVGIITERDIVRMLGAEQVFTLQLAARDVMSKPVVTIGQTNSVKDALQQMQLSDIRRLPVVDKEKKIVGIVTERDIFRAMMNSQSLIMSFCESLMVEYKPVYERLGEFIAGEVPKPGGIP